MSFDDLRQQLAGGRTKRDDAAHAAAQAQEQVNKLKRTRAKLARAVDPQSEADRARLAQLDEQIKRAEAVAARRRAGYAEIADSVAGLYKEFQPFTDPREMIGQLNDTYPILLLPLRIETRFKSAAGVPGAAARVPQLWVRVYPDECAVDRFEPVLSEAEIHSAQIFWAEMWAAGGVEDLERSAWRGLVASHGAGRAAWIARAYLPENAVEQPVKTGPDDVILVVASEEALSAADKTAAAAYWTVVWGSDGEAGAVQAAGQALEAAVGAERAGVLATRFQPSNLTATPAPPLTKADVAVTVAFIDFPTPETVESKLQSWSQAPKVNVLPERLVLVGYQGDTVAFEVVGNPIPSPLVAGPDPSAPEAEQLRPEDGDLIFPDDIQWMVDFERAVQVGMGFRVTLTQTQASRGFDRLIVLGVRLSADEQGGKGLVEALFEHHHYSRVGISLIPQGTPTNNTDKGGAGFSHGEDADATFKPYLKGETLYTTESDPLLRRDGQWLADYLGLDPAVVQKIDGSGGTDQLEARAMNVALWNGTLGYMMDTMMAPLFGPDDTRFTRAFFTNFVSGRGPLPALRIGAQPYGILPTSVFSRMRWLLRRGGEGPVLSTHVPVSSSTYLVRLYALLRRMDEHWAQMALDVARVKDPPAPGDDPHQILLDILGLHPGSVEYHQRYAESVDHLFNMMNIYGVGGSFLGALIAAGYVKSGMDLLAEFGYAGDATPDVLERLFLSNQHLMKGPVIDDRPLSETEAIRVYTADNRNYVQWLIDAARTSLETLRRQDGFLDNKSPAALFYILARYALMQSYWITSIRLYELAGVLDTSQVQAVRHEPPFVHVTEQAQVSESRFQHLYTTSAAVTGNPELLVADHITQILPQTTGTQAIATADLREQVEALERLRDVPTARLERLFAEHVDTVGYRLDAWELGLLNYQLMLMRYPAQAGEGEDTVRRGLYVGAYGWIEDLRPEGKQLTPVTLDPDLDAEFNTDPAAPPLMRDPTNGGYVHAPSLNHAVTAAILRNGYLANATPSAPSALAVNLSSDRVRRAISAIEGIRAGQSLGALLGYQFERGLHDRHNQAEVDGFIYELRKAFPLVAKQLRATEPSDDTGIEALEARNVIDGLKLAEHIRATGQDTYPFGKDLPVADTNQKAAINAEVQRMLDTHDAVADVAIAESVHQAAQGNYDRAAGTLDTYTKGNFPPIPDVIQTPRSGITLTHRVGLHLRSGLNPAASPVPGMAVTPRSQAEPALNDWLASVLPAPAGVLCTAIVTDPVTLAETPLTVSQQDLGLQPIDLLYILTHETQPAMGELDDRVMRHVLSVSTPRPDASIRIEYTRKAADLSTVTFFELMPLIGSLRKLALSSRPLRPSDVMLHNEAQPVQDQTLALDRARVTTAQAGVTALRDDVAAFQAPLQALFDDLTAHRGDILSGIDTFSDDLIGLLERASRAGIPQTGWGFIYQRRAAIYTRLLDSIAARVIRWNDRLAAFDAAMIDYDALPPSTLDAERFDLLIQAERWVTTQPENPLPATPADLRALLDTKRAAFAGRLAAFDALLDGNGSLPGLLASTQALLPIDAFDLDPFPITASEDEIVLFADDLLGTAAGLVADLETRLNTAQAQLDAHDATADPAERIAALQAGAKALLGPDFALIPEFTLDAAQGVEWENAFTASGSLLDYLTGTLKVDFPVDEWLYGAARVREKLHHWERALLLAEGFGRTPPTLTPVQLPHLDGDRWLALDFPDDYVIDGDRLLYTAHYPAGFNRNAAQCGLLVDEWTEIIPGTEETTGITFHYDRPNAEPPQAMLLVTPPQFVGQWQWQDLVDTLHETLAMARKRAVEPAQVDKTALARFLPATVMSVTLYGLSITANLAINNGLYTVLGDSNG